MMQAVTHSSIRVVVVDLELIIFLLLFIQVKVVSTDFNRVSLQIPLVPTKRSDTNRSPFVIAKRYLEIVSENNKNF